VKNIYIYIYLHIQKKKQKCEERDAKRQKTRRECGKQFDVIGLDKNANANKDSRYRFTFRVVTTKSPYEARHLLSTKVSLMMGLGL
jgi:hypothetical protein